MNLLGGNPAANYCSVPECISPENDNCNVCQNIRKSSTFYVECSQKPKSYIKLQPQKPKNKLGIIIVIFSAPDLNHNFLNRALSTFQKL
jgi:hypothetical protein